MSPATHGVITALLLSLLYLTLCLLYRFPLFQTVYLLAQTVYLLAQTVSKSAYPSEPPEKTSDQSVPLHDPGFYCPYREQASLHKQKTR